MSELIFPTINFLALVALLFFFTRKPVREMVLTRYKTFKDRIEGAQKEKHDAEKLLRDFEDKLRSLESEAEMMLERAKKDAEVLKQGIIESAKQNAVRILHDAEEASRANFEDYKDQVRREIINKAVEMAEKIVTSRLSVEDHHRIVTEYVEKVQVQ